MMVWPRPIPPGAAFQAGSRARKAVSRFDPRGKARTREDSET